MPRGTRTLKISHLISLVGPVACVVATDCGRPPDRGPTLFAARPAPTVQPLPDAGFRVEWVSNTIPMEVKAGSKTAVTVTFKNVGIAVWLDPRSTGHEPPQAGAVRLSYRWLPSGGRPLGYAVERIDLRGPLAPGQAATLAVSVSAPPKPGAYRLQFDLVQEFVAWFEAMDATRLIIPVHVL